MIIQFGMNRIIIAEGRELRAKQKSRQRARRMLWDFRILL